MRRSHGRLPQLVHSSSTRRSGWRASATLRAIALVCLPIFVLVSLPVDAAKNASGSKAATSRRLSRGVDSLIAEIRRQEFSLERRSRELVQREAAVEKLEELIEERLAELERIRADIERRIESWTDLEGDRIVQLSKVYSAMPPERAAALMSKLELDHSVAIIRKMKQKQSAALLAAMRSDRAIILSKRLLEPLSPATAR